MKFYKILHEDASCFWGGKGKWFLPEESKAGKWMPTIKGNLSACTNGYHVLTAEQLILWLGPAIFEVEVKGKGISEEDKSVYPQARLLRKLKHWNERTARLFACDCAEHVVALFEKKFPTDQRPSKAIKVSRLFADGKATKEELAAAGDAAGAAAWDAARAAGWDAARAAAGAAARAAAWDAAGDAAGAAAWDAAWAAAWDAAGDAAGDAARDAAGDAAGDAAREAERKWQTELLKQVLGI